MKEPERLAKTIETVFKVPALHVVDPEEAYKRARLIAEEGRREGSWEAFTTEQQAQLAVAYQDARWDQIHKSIGVPTRLAYANLDARDRDDRPTAAVQNVKDYMAGDFFEGACLVLTGPTGVGKTYASVGGLRAAQALKRVPARRFWYFPALCGALLDPSRRHEALAGATTITMLVLDDLGVEYVKEGGLIDTFLDEIIWTREAEYLPTIITTNLTTDALKQRLPSRLVDRLRGDWGRVFECPGESLRSHETVTDDAV